MDRNEYQNQIAEEVSENRRPQGISDLLRMPEKKVKTKGGINSVFNDAVARAIECMGDTEHKFGYWCGRLRGVPPQLISEWISRCKGATSPIKLFQYLLKEYKKKLSTATGRQQKSEGVI